MKDFLGNEVKVGDSVVCMEKGYSNLIHAKVVKLTPQAIKVVYTKWDGGHEVLRTPAQFIKVENESL